MNKNSVIYFSLAAIFALMIVFLPSGCKDKKHETQKPSQKRVIGLYVKADGSVESAVLLMQILVAAKYDSAKGKYDVVTDTIWGIPRMRPLIDTATKIQKVDSAGVKQFVVDYIIYPKDSVIWRIEGRDYDSLIKKRK